MTIASPQRDDVATRPFIEVRDVSQVFRTQTRGEVAALQDIDLTIREGEFLSVLGPSGCGKSTLMRIIAGLVKPSSGDVLLRGEKVDKPGRDVGVVFQQAALFPWRSVKKNVLLSAEMLGLPKDVAEQRAEELLDMVGIEMFWGRKPATAGR